MHIIKVLWQVGEEFNTGMVTVGLFLETGRVEGWKEYFNFFHYVIFKMWNWKFHEGMIIFYYLFCVLSSLLIYVCGFKDLNL